MVLAHNVLEKPRTTDIKISQDITFDNMLLAERTLAGLKESGFFVPSPIQLHAIPLGICGFDIILEAKSGTGKTAVFSIITLEKLDLNKGLQVIILAPTREIAAQICEVIRQIGCKYEGLGVEVVIGGLPLQDDINKFKTNNVQVVVGSPGRLKHLIYDKHIDIKSVRFLVLDEADKLMENIFLADIKYIFLSLPSQKQVILSSATYPDYTKELINQFVYGAQHICPDSDSVLLGIVQKVIYVKHNNNIVKQTENRFKELLNILSKIQFRQCLIFCNYQTRVGELHKKLTKEKWPSEQLYGKQEQMDRLDALKTLQEYKCRILVSTDLAARGIDASNVDLVINFEPPSEWQTYLHRIGRAGRYGSYGMAITILSEGIEQKKFISLLKQLKLNDNFSPVWNEEEDENVLNKQIVPLCLEISSQAIISNDNNFDGFWDLLCDTEKTQKNATMYESFDHILKSYTEFENSNIESFSELFTSYTAFNNNSLESNSKGTPNNSTICEYRNISWPKVSETSYVHSMKCIKGGIIKNKKLKCENFEDFHGQKPLQVNNINDLEINNKTMDNVSETIEFINLGTPVEFSTSKDKARKKSKLLSDYQCTNSKSEKATKKSKRLDINSFTENVKSDSSSSLKKKSTFFDTTSKSKTNCPDCLPSVSNRNVYSKSNVMSTNHSYAKWYSQLKFKIKQIEMTLYIDELGKL